MSIKKIFLMVVFFLHSTAMGGTPPIPIGQRFILSLPKTHHRATLESWLKKTKPSGVMLEAWHMRNRATIKETVEHLQAGARHIGIPPLLVTIDWEGGIVSRVHEGGGFVSVPAPYNLAKGGRSTCFLAGKLIGRQLHSIGVNMVFAPVLDLFDAHNCVLATRCFSDDPKKVFDCGLAFAHGVLSEGVIPVVKHFPGLGRGLSDTHLVDVKIDFDTKSFQKHVEPFLKMLDEGVPAVMVSHAEYSTFESKPASQSMSVVNYLRSYNADVLLITDDIAMMAFNNAQRKIRALTTGLAFSMNEAFLDDVMTSLTAEFQLLIFSELPEKQIALLEALEDLGAQRHLPGYTSVVEKINEVKSRFIGKTPASFVDFDEKELAQTLAARGNTRHVWIEDLKHKKVLLISVDIPKIRPEEDWFISQKNSYLGTLLKGACAELLEVIADANDKASVEAITKCVKLSKHYDVIILQTFFYGQGIWNKNQEAWLKRVAPLDARLIIFSLGHPYEQQLLKRTAHVVHLGAFHRPDIDVSCKRLRMPPVVTGADRLMQTPQQFLYNKRIALLCHNCSWVHVNEREKFLPDAVLQWVKQQKNQTRLVALFSPEHGLLGTQEAAALVESERESKWECPIYSLHGKVRAPTDDMLKGVDVLLIDLQEVGVRCYTYVSTMILTLEAAAKHGIEVIVLDRPNPLKILGQQGPVLEASCESFLGKIAVPFMHGQSMGSLAKQINEKYHAKLTVLECRGTADDYFITHFRRPSPNLVSYDSLLVYPMTVVLEGTNYSEGRGTTMPFQQLGAPWVDAHDLALTLNKKQLPGVYFEPIEFTPESITGVAEHPKHQGQLCRGVFIHVVDHKVLQPVSVARALLEVLWNLYPQQSTFLQWGDKYALDLLVGTPVWREEIVGNMPVLS
jgi:uncharacterized protein YbbC (DUF1343 family)/beta-glucosidase-like glycosyl hydrolase